jgi:hypothetical protein
MQPNTRGPSTALLHDCHACKDNIANMTKALSATAFPKWKGEIDAGPTLNFVFIDLVLDTLSLIITLN